ncbi:hypothetical protein ACMA5I_15230 [Paracoccaceae bacterium GXU_MW_L88]
MGRFDGQVNNITIRGGNRVADVHAGLKASDMEKLSKPVLFASNGAEAHIAPKVQNFTAHENDQLVRTLSKDLIVNGSFDAHANARKLGYWRYEKGIHGWSTAANGKEVMIHTRNYETGNRNGNAIVELDHRAGQVEGIKQVANVPEAGTYQISFDYGMRDTKGKHWYSDAYSNAVAVRIDGKLVHLAGDGVYCCDP